MIKKRIFNENVFAIGLLLGAVIFDAGSALGAVSADFVGKDSSDADNNAESVGPFNYGTFKADLAPLTIASASLSSGGGRTIGFSDSAGISSGSSITVTLTNGTVDSATDQSYYLAIIDSGAGGAGTIDAVATDVVSGAAVISGLDTVLTFSTTSNVAAGQQLVVVRSKDASSGSAHNYSDGNTAQSPTWVIDEDATGDFSANVTGGSSDGFVRIAIARAPVLSTSLTSVNETIDVSNVKVFSSYVRSEYNLICATEKYNTVLNQSYDDYDQTYPGMKVAIADDVPSGGLIDVGKISGWADFADDEVTVTTIIHGPMAAISAIYWDLDNSGTFDADESFAIDIGTDTATLTWDPAESGNDQVSGGNRNVKIQFNGTTALASGSYYATHSASAGGVTVTLAGNAYLGNNGELKSNSSLCSIGGFNGARFRPNYLYSRNDNQKQLVRIGIDINGGPSSQSEIQKSSFDVYVRAAQVTGTNFVKVGTVTPPNELILSGYGILASMTNAGYATGAAPKRLDVDFVIEGLGINYTYDTVNNPMKAFKLNVVSMQYSPEGWVVMPVRAVTQDASTNDVVRNF